MAGLANDEDSVMEWIRTQFEGREITAGTGYKDGVEWDQKKVEGNEIISFIAEFETDYPWYKQHHFVVFDYPCVYHWSQRVLREGESVPTEKDRVFQEDDSSWMPLSTNIYMIWYSGALWVQTSDRPDGRPQVEHRVFSPERKTWLEVTFLEVGDLLGTKRNPFAGFQSSERVSPEGADPIRYVCSFESGAKSVAEFQGTGEPFPITHYFETAEGEISSRYDYKDWYFFDGKYFPGEVVITLFQQPDRVLDSPIIFKYKMLNLYSLNKHVHAAWFIPSVGPFDTAIDAVPVGQDIWSGAFMPISIRREEDMLEKYRQFLPSGY
jgi:hypothetical protein